MLTPMEFQMLVGLCCVRHDPGAVRIVVGDMVPDEASESSRDVDVTVKVHSGTGSFAIAGYDVKLHSRRLDSGHADSLIRKLQDMPSLQERAIVSASGFTAPALKKIHHHGLVAYEFRDWQQSEDFDPYGPGMRQGHVEAQDLCWLTCTVRLNPSDANRSGLAFDDSSRVQVYSGDDFSSCTRGTLEETLADIGQQAISEFRRKDEVQDLLLDLMNDSERSNQRVSDPFDVAVIVSVEKPVFIERNGEPCRIEEVLMCGQLVWRREPLPTGQKEMVNCSTGEIFAQATIGRVNDDWLLACLCSPHDTFMEARSIRLTEEHKRRIQHLTLLAR